MKTRTLHTLTTENDGLSRLVYAHIPKTGGNTVLASIDRLLSVGHKSADDKRSDNCFSTVRNPFEWLISLWYSNWKPSGIGQGCTKKYSIQQVWPDLETFLYEFNSFKPTSAQPWNAVFGWHASNSLGNGQHIPLYSHRHLQVCQTFDNLNMPGEKHSYAAFYIRLEKLEEAINQFPQNKIKENRPQRAGSSSHKDYRYYYDTKLIDHIAAHRKQELDLLGYDFEGPTDDLAVFKVNKPFVWK